MLGNEGTMPKKTSTIRPVILRHAVACFGDRGLDGVTTRDLAAAAGVTESSIYRLFESKENLYQESIHAAITRVRESIRSPGTRLPDTLRSWFEALPRPDARLLEQVLKRVHPADRRLLEQVSSPIAGIIATVAGLIQDSRVSALDSKATSSHAQIMVMALFHLKIFQADEQPSKGERQRVDALIESWAELITPEEVM
jgi:AcrR family transcriptional regulator